MPRSSFTSLRAAGLLCLALACAPTAQAAGLACAKAATASEKAICADSYTLQLDSQLASAWTTALAQSREPKALRQAQRQWLKERDDCQANLACLRGTYQSRLLELPFVNVPFAWQGTWQRVSTSPYFAGELFIRRLAQDRLDFEISGMGGANSGALQGEARIQGNEAHYAVEGCSLVFRARDGLLEVDQEGESYACGAGSGVNYSGRYVASKRELKPHYDLLSTALVHTEEEDRQARQLLGADYQTLLDSGSVFIEQHSAELPDAQVTQMWLRGVANTNAAIFLRGPQGQLWTAMLVVQGPADEVRVRYYSNVPEWKHSLPDVVQAWYEERTKGKRLALDMMP